MTNNDRLLQIVSNVQQLSELAKSMIDAEMYPVSFFSQGFDLIQKIQSDFHTLEADQVEMFAEQLKKHQALILSIHQQMRVFSTQTKVLIPPVFDPDMPENEPMSILNPLDVELKPATLPVSGTTTPPPAPTVQPPEPKAQPPEPKAQPPEPTVQQSEPKVVTEELLLPEIPVPLETDPKTQLHAKETGQTEELEKNEKKTKKTSFFSRLGLSSTDKVAEKRESQQETTDNVVDKTTDAQPEIPISQSASAPPQEKTTPFETAETRPVKHIASDSPPPARPAPIEATNRPARPIVSEALPPVRPVPIEAANRPARPIVSEAPPPVRQAPIEAANRPARPIVSEALPPVRPAPIEAANRPARPIVPEAPPPVRPTPIEAANRPARPIVPEAPPPVRPTPIEAANRPARPISPDTPPPVRPASTDETVVRPVRPASPAVSTQPERPLQTDKVIQRPIRPTPSEETSPSATGIPSFLASLGTNTLQNEALSETPPTDSQHPTINDAIEKKKMSDLRKAFSLNDRFRYRKELFAGSEEAMNKAIAILNNKPSFNESVQFLEQKLHWDFSDPTVKDFVKILELRFL